MRESVPSNRRVTFFLTYIMAVTFTKPPKTWQEQVAILESRGMVIKNQSEASFYLRHLNYYRLSAYWLPFENDHSTHSFQKGTSFEDVLNLYIFDRQLRLLVLDAIERVEVSVRSAWAYHLAHAYGSHAHLNPLLAYNRKWWQSNIDTLTEEVKRSDEIFIQHLRSTYSESLPPVWAVCEIMSLGLLSRWYDNLRPMPVRRNIANTYQLDEATLGSWLHHLSLMRNNCAHHSRVWNREFTITPQSPKNKPIGFLARSQWVHGSRKLYNSLVILLHFMDIVAPRHHWRNSLKSLIDQHGIEVHAMGFPGNWKSLSIWQ